MQDEVRQLIPQTVHGICVDLLVRTIDDVEPPVGEGDSVGSGIVLMQSEIDRRIALPVAGIRVYPPSSVSANDDVEPVIAESDGFGPDIGFLQLEPVCLDMLTQFGIRIDFLVGRIENVEPSGGQGDSCGVAVVFGQVELRGLIALTGVHIGVNPSILPVDDMDSVAGVSDPCRPAIVIVQVKSRCLIMLPGRGIGVNPGVRIDDLQPAVDQGDSFGVAVVGMQVEIGRCVLPAIAGVRIQLSVDGIADIESSVSERDPARIAVVGTQVETGLGIGMSRAGIRIYLVVEELVAIVFKSATDNIKPAIRVRDSPRVEIALIHQVKVGCYVALPGLCVRINLCIGPVDYVIPAIGVRDASRIAVPLKQTKQLHCTAVPVVFYGDAEADHVGIAVFIRCGVAHRVGAGRVRCAAEPACCGVERQPGDFGREAVDQRPIAAAGLRQRQMLDGRPDCIGLTPGTAGAAETRNAFLFFGIARSPRQGARRDGPILNRTADGRSTGVSRAFGELEVPVFVQGDRRACDACGITSFGQRLRCERPPPGHARQGLVHAIDCVFAGAARRKLGGQPPGQFRHFVPSGL